MNGDTKNQIRTLAELQLVENERIRIRSILSAVSDKIKASEKRLAVFVKSLDEESDALDVLKRQYRDFEDDFQKNESRIQKNQEHLKTVTTNKEYQVLLREIDEKKKVNSTIEDEMLTMLDEIEKKQQQVDEREKELVQLKSQVESEISDIENRNIDDREELERLGLKRDEIAGRVKPKILARYNNILDQVGNVAIVPVERGVCTGCNMNLPPQLFIDIQKGEEMNYCPWCQRILYYTPPESE